MKFPLAQEVSRHVRDKACKFYKTIQSPTCTITSDEAAQSSQTSPKAFSLITPDSIKFQSCGNEKVLGQGLDLIENNFADLLLPSTFGLVSSNMNEEHEFGMLIGDIGSSVEHEEVEVSFACKLCGFR